MFDLAKKEDIDAIRSRATATARANGFSQLAEDFTSQVIVWFLSGKRAHSTFDQMFVDFLRVEYGSTRSSSGIKRQRAKHYIQLEEIAECLPDNNCAGSDAFGAEPGLERISRDFAKLFRGRALDIYERICQLETQDSIAFLYGVTPSRISQIVSTIKKEIEHASIVKETKDRLKLEPDFGVFKVDWIRL